jgi:hypothetical protein
LEAVLAPKPAIEVLLRKYTGKTPYYGGRKFQSLRGQGFKANYFDIETGEEYWISGCKRDGTDRLYGGTTHVDEDVRAEYWRTIRRMPECQELAVTKNRAKYT